MSKIVINKEKAKKLIPVLFEIFQTDGIFGRKDMPEDVVPAGIQRGSLEHLLFITLTVAIDYQRDAIAMWESARKTFEDPETRYLFDPKALHETKMAQVILDMKKHGLSKKSRNDAEIWRTNAVTFYKKWNGNPREFLENCGWDATVILKRLKTDTHLNNGRLVSDYPFLRGDKIGPLWIRMLRDNVCIKQLQKLNEVAIPVDIHIARASLCLGVVTGNFSGNLTDVFEAVREVWAKGVCGLEFKYRQMIALDVDEPLWHLSKFGCKYRSKDNGSCSKKRDCPVNAHCIDGRVSVIKNHVELST